MNTGMNTDITIDFAVGTIPLASVMASATNLLLMSDPGYRRVIIQSHSKAGTLVVMLEMFDNRKIKETFEWRGHSSGANTQMNLPLDTPR